LQHVVEDCAAAGRRIVLEGDSPLQKKIRFERLVGALRSDRSA